MELSPLYPEAKEKKTVSQGNQNWRDSTIHPLLTTQGLVRVRTHLSIVDWLLTGSCIQGLILLIAPRSIPLFYTLAPTFGLAAFKITRCALKCLGVLENKLMKNVKVGRNTAVFPEPDGGLIRPVGSTIGGGSMVVVLLTSRSHHPLGMFYPPYMQLGDYGRAIYTTLEKKAGEFGVLGYSDYNSNLSTTHPVNLSILYFKSMEHLHRFAHGEVHRAGWDWWNKMSAEGKLDLISIGHEVYEVDAGKWENVKHNAEPFDFAATSHAIKTAGGERRWVCPVMDASKGFKSSAGRMGNVKT